MTNPCPTRRLSHLVTGECATRRYHSRRKRWNIPPQRLHIQIVRHQQPIAPNATADDVADDCWGQTAWQIPVPCGVNNMRGHSHRRDTERPEWRNIDFQLSFSSEDRRVWQECDRTCRNRGYREQSKK